MTEEIISFKPRYLPESSNVSTRATNNMQSQKIDPKVKFSSFSDMVGVLQNIVRPRFHGHLCLNVTILTGSKQLLRTIMIEPFTHAKRQSSRVVHYQHNKYLAGLFVALSLTNLCLLEARYIQPSQKYTLLSRLSVIPQFTSA